MQLRLLVRGFLQRSLLVVFWIAMLLMYLVLTGCHSSSRNSAPAIAFGKVAAAYQEGPYKTDMTERDSS
jgi:hypothetical protein